MRPSRGVGGQSLYAGKYYLQHTGKKKGTNIYRTPTVQMSGTVLSALHELSHLLLITAPSGRISIFIFMAKEPDPENQNELLVVTQLKRQWSQDSNVVISR